MLRVWDGTASPVGGRHLCDRPAASAWSWPCAPRSKDAVDNALRRRSLSCDGLRLGLRAGCGCSSELPASLLCLLRLEVLADLCSESTVSLLCLLCREVRLADLSACGDAMSSGLRRRSVWADWCLDISNDDVDECRRRGRCRALALMWSVFALVVWLA